MIQIHPLRAIGGGRHGDDLARTLANAVRAAGIMPVASDVLAVTQKIVSKSEGRFVDLDTVTPGPKALELAEVTRKDPRLVELVLAASQKVVRAVTNGLRSEEHTSELQSQMRISY